MMQTLTGRNVATAKFEFEGRSRGTRSVGIRAAVRRGFRGCPGRASLPAGQPASLPGVGATIVAARSKPTPSDPAHADALAMPTHPTQPLPPPPPFDDAERLARAEAFAEQLTRRRTVRDYAPTPVPRAVIEACLRAAASAPSGANQQPWHFVAVADPALKRRIREAAETEEREFYERRAPDEWLQALSPLGTDADKPFLETAPWLIAIFFERTGPERDGSKAKRYYPHESTGIACGLLIAALHDAGLCTLTHTPSPMGFLNELLARPRHEVPYLLLVVGHPAPGCRVPAIERKPLAEVATFL
jgi:iodotyrosine deiodinase